MTTKREKTSDRKILELGVEPNGPSDDTKDDTKDRERIVGKHGRVDRKEDGEEDEDRTKVIG